MLYPWLQSAYEEACKVHQQGSFPANTLLKLSEEGGALAYLHALAQLLLEESGADALGPDALILEPIVPAKSISIEQIRTLKTHVYATAVKGRVRVVLIPSLERLSPGAAQAFLKILEDAPTGVFFLAACTQTQILLPTLLSRFQLQLLPKPSLEVCLAWLKTEGVSDPLPAFEASGENPLSALDIGKDAKRVALFHSFQEDCQALLKRTVTCQQFVARYQHEPLIFRWWMGWVQRFLRTHTLTLTGRDAFFQFYEQLTAFRQAEENRQALNLKLSLMQLSTQLSHLGEDLHHG